MNLRRLVALAVTTAVLAIIGCSSTTPTEPLGTNVQVALDEWSVIPKVTQVGSGQINFLASNEGSLQHELVVLKTDLPASDLVVTDGKVDEEASGTVIGQIDPADLAPGKQASTTLNLEPGTYVLFCNLTGHYALGMRAGFTIAN